MRNVVFCGATKGMGRELARRMAERGDRLFLLGRDAEEMGRVASDLQARSDAGNVPRHHPLDLEHPEGFSAALDAADADLSGFDTVVISAAIFATQEQLEADPDLALRLLRVNFAHTVALCEDARKRLLARGGGTLCVFSSVAGDRGRKPVAIYGSSKAGLSHYLESLDHKFRDQGLVTICVKPGFVKTGATADLSPPPFAGEPGPVAETVLQAIDRGTPLVYTPGIWRLVMLAIRHMPRQVMRRVGF